MPIGFERARVKAASVCSELAVVAFAFWSYVVVQCIESFPIFILDSNASHVMPCTIAKFIFAFSFARLSASLRFVFIICFARCWVAWAWAWRKQSVHWRLNLYHEQRAYTRTCVLRCDRCTPNRMELFRCDWHYLFTKAFYYYILLLRRYWIRLPVVCSSTATRLESVSKMDFQMHSAIAIQIDAWGDRMRKLCIAR